MTQKNNINAIEQLLPFYLNGTLEDDEAKQVERALQHDTYLQQELSLLKNLQQRTKQRASSPSPGELGLKRLQRSIKTESSSRKQVPPTKAWQLTAIAASLLLVVQTATTLLPSDDYQAAGGNVTQQTTGTLLSVTFAPDITEQTLRQLLLQYHIVIVDGPSALGVYQVVLPLDSNATLEQLRQHDAIFDSIQTD